MIPWCSFTYKWYHGTSTVFSRMYSTVLATNTDILTRQPPQNVHNFSSLLLPIRPSRGPHYSHKVSRHILLKFYRLSAIYALSAYAHETVWATCLFEKRFSNNAANRASPSSPNVSLESAIHTYLMLSDVTCSSRQALDTAYKVSSVFLTNSSR